MPDFEEEFWKGEALDEDFSSHAGIAEEAFLPPILPEVEEELALSHSPYPTASQTVTVRPEELEWAFVPQRSGGTPKGDLFPPWSPLVLASLPQEPLYWPLDGLKRLALLPRELWPLEGLPAFLVPMERGEYARQVLLKAQLRGPLELSRQALTLLEVGYSEAELAAILEAEALVKPSQSRALPQALEEAKELSKGLLRELRRLLRLGHEDQVQHILEDLKNLLARLRAG